jgi:hypothetical protein
VTFENWYDENLKTMLKEHNLHSALEWAWKTAQEAERERIVKIIFEATSGFGINDYLLEKINEH